MELSSENTTLTLPYGSGHVEIEVPSELLLFDGTMPDVKALGGPESIRRSIKRALREPTGTPPLEKLLGPDSTVLILIEDNTRDSPLIPVLTSLLDYITEAGVPEKRISLMTAPGTHRTMTETELRKKVGDSIYRSFEVVQHDYRDTSSLVDLGTVEAGGSRVPVQVNRRVVEADVVIGTGNIKPHPDAGYSGGAKILQPGVCGYATTAATHISAAMLDEIPLGIAENPCRHGIEKAAEKAGLDFIVNTVCNHRNEIVDVVAGDPKKAHRRGAETAAAAYGVRIPEPADIVVVSSYPAEIDWWQANKGLIAACFAVKPGGTIVLLSPACEGLEHNHPKLREWLPFSYTEAHEKAQSVPLEDASQDLIAADIAMCNSRAREKADIILVSDGLSEEEATLLGYEKASSLDEALRRARKHHPRGRIGFLPRGGDALPLFG